MQLLNIYLEGIPNQFTLRFRGRGKAEAAQDYASAVNWRGTIEDDFGQIFKATGTVVALQLIDVDQDLEVQVTLARLQNEAAQAAQRPAPSVVRAAATGLMRPQ